MKILFISLGCDKNLVDTEVMLGLLASRGHVMTDDEAEAEAIIINTCCFIHDAKEESIQNILEMAEYKKTGCLKALIVTGCLAQRYRQEILDEIPEVDACWGRPPMTRFWNHWMRRLRDSRRCGLRICSPFLLWRRSGW